jgi:hypothetical protein
MRVTISTSPARRKSSTVRSSSRPVAVVPLRFSERIKSQPVAQGAFLNLKVLVRAYEGVSDNGR